MWRYETGEFINSLRLNTLREPPSALIRLSSPLENRIAAEKPLRAQALPGSNPVRHRNAPRARAHFAAATLHPAKHFFDFNFLEESESFGVA